MCYSVMERKAGDKERERERENDTASVLREKRGERENRYGKVSINMARRVKRNRRHRLDNWQVTLV